MGVPLFPRPLFHHRWTENWLDAGTHEKPCHALSMHDALWAQDIGSFDHNQHVEPVHRGSISTDNPAELAFSSVTFPIRSRSSPTSPKSSMIGAMGPACVSRMRWSRSVDLPAPRNRVSKLAATLSSMRSAHARSRNLASSLLILLCYKIT